jgi:hypothetical protein
MTDELKGRPNQQRAIERQNRLRDALRENLKRRKSQFRGRTGQAATTAGPGACGGDTASSHTVPVEQDET